MHKVLCFRAKLIRPKYQEKSRRVEEIKSSIKNAILVLQIMQDYCEEFFGSQLEIIMAFGLPPLLYPFYQLVFRGPKP
jgi:hypothetical protein